MKQKLLQKTLLLLFALIAGSTSVWADEVVHYTLDGTITSGGNSNYAQDGGGLTQNGIAWSVTGNTTINPWRIGGKVSSGTAAVDREAYSKTAMNSAITKIELEIGDINLSSVNSIKLIVASNSDFSTVVDEITQSPVSPATSIAANQTLTFQPTSPATKWATGAYYKLVFNVTLTTSNKYIEVESVKFYKEVTLTDPTITFSNGSVRVGKTLDLSTLFTSNSTGAVTYSITSGGSNASIDGSTLTGVAVGDVIVKAQQAAKDEYNAGEESATISVVDPALSSISITTAPTKTEYDEGESFDATGMVVTATFADASTEDVTALCTWTPDGALTTSDTEVTISYTYNAVTKTATQDITVNAYVQPTEFDINLNNALFGTSYTGSASGITDEDPVIGTLNHVTVTYAGSSNHYINDSQIRFYPNNKLTFAAPAGYVITKIVFTADGTWSATINSDKGTYTSDTKTWTGAVSTVLFTGSGSGHCRMSKATITLSNTIPVTITTADYATFCSAVDLDFSETGITVYQAKVESNKVKFTEVTDGLVPAYTGVLLYKDVDAETVVNVPVTTGVAALSENELVGVTTEEAIEYNPDTDVYNYILQMNGANLVFRKATGAKLRANRAYLSTSYDVTAPGARELEVSFGDETAINALENSNKVNDGAIYDLSGRRVENPTKGIYIMNGKKVVIK